MTKTKTLNVDLLTRVEGQGALRVTVEGDRVADLRLRIFEPPRFFEAFLRGREAHEVPDLVARICGICPVAYQMSATHALEALFGVPTSDLLVDGARQDLVWILTGGPHVGVPAPAAGEAATPGPRAPSDYLVLNVTVDPADEESPLGFVVDGVGFPNGRRLGDDIVDIVFSVLGGFLYDGTTLLGDGVDANDIPFRPSFPYVGYAHPGDATRVMLRPNDG